jgi:hypothetical protein
MRKEQNLFRAEKHAQSSPPIAREKLSKIAIKRTTIVDRFQIMLN